MFWEYAWLIPIFPLVLVPVALILGSKMKKEGAEVGILGTIVSLIMSIGVALEYLSNPTNRELNLVTWVKMDEIEIGLSLRIDPLSIIMILLVSFIATLIMIYSLGYMHGESGLPRYFGEMLLFVGSMLLIVMSADLLTLFIGWEGVGVSSYLLIGFWYTRPPAASAAKKAFLTTKMGDVFMTAGIAMIFWKFGTLKIMYVLEHIDVLDPKTKFLIGLFLFLGAVGKSAQFPLLAWLWDAMEGPTTVSAILHSSTMVKAGVFLVARMFPLIIASPELMLVIAYVGSFTAFIAATMALVEMDIKRVLAYSTISQIGYMMAAIGLGSAVAGILHLISHAFFKALLFLVAGSVVHAMHHIIHDPWLSRDMRYMGGLKNRMKITYYTALIGGAALAGIPLFSGFWTKDLIIEIAALREDAFVYWLLLITALLTAFYIARLIFLTFHGEFRGHKDAHGTLKDIHESPGVMTMPMMALAIATLVLSIVLPFTQTGFFEFFEKSYEGIHITYEHEIAGTFTPYIHGPILEPTVVFSVLLVLGGLAIAYLAYIRGVINVAVVERNSLLRIIYKLLSRKYYIDDFYLLVSEGFAYKVVSRVASWIDRTIIDGIVNGVGKAGILIAKISALFDKYVIDGIVNGIGIALKRIGGYFKAMQVGIVEDYALLFALGVIIVFVLGLILIGFIPILSML